MFRFRNGDYQNPEIILYSGLRIKLRKPEIGLYLAREYIQKNIFIIFFFQLLFFEYFLSIVSKQTSFVFYIRIK